MVDIVDPRAIKFANEQLRPTCEKLRALMAELTALKVDWSSGISALFPNLASHVLVDDRVLAGQAVLTGEDVNKVVAIFLSVLLKNKSDVLAKPCTRPLRMEVCEQQDSQVDVVLEQASQLLQLLNDKLPEVLDAPSQSGALLAS